MDLQALWNEHSETLIEYGTSLATVIVFLVVGLAVAGWVGRAARKALLKAQLENTLAIFFGKMARWLTLAIVIMGCLGRFGIDMTSFAAVLAAAGFAVGMALQGSLGNFASGVMLLLFRPFTVGQVVNAAGTTGTVVEIGVFTTVFDTPDNRRIIVPNGIVFGGTIENISHHVTRRVDVEVGTDYGADLDQTREVLMAAAKSVSAGLSDPEPAIVLAGLGGSCIDWKVRLWVNADDFWPVKDALTRAVKQHLDQASIGIPFPQLDVHMEQLGG
ncbi:MAG: mechanosensitive ion channel family protein [Planctomycetota bacterium]|nr:MAG: mechanosensitive ion channel family protein [Planctomycetota bacterium]